MTLRGNTCSTVLRIRIWEWEFNRHSQSFSDPKVRKALTFAAITTRVVSTDETTFNDEEMHMLMEYTCKVLIDDDYIKTDKQNLFQEENI